MIWPASVLGEATDPMTGAGVFQLAWFRKLKADAVNSTARSASRGKRLASDRSWFWMPGLRIEMVRGALPSVKSGGWVKAAGLYHRFGLWLETLGETPGTTLTRRALMMPPVLLKSASRAMGPPSWRVEMSLTDQPSTKWRRQSRKLRKGLPAPMGSS